MNGIAIPAGAVGRVGLVAALKGVPEADLGKLVVVREPAGVVTALVGSATPIFAWRVQTLGSPIKIRGRLGRYLYVADRCLMPVGDMTAAEIAFLCESQAQDDLDSVWKDLDLIMARDPPSAETLQRAIHGAAECLAIRLALEVMPVSAVLQETGFVPEHGGEALQWTGIHQGTELHLFASADWLGNWRIAGTAHLPRQAVWDERCLPAEAPRGQILKTILDIWRTAFGRAAAPDCLEVGLTYEQHRRALGKLRLDAPELDVDPAVFRQTLRWLRERHGDLLGQKAVVTLTFADGLLRLETEGFTYGCPARGTWVDECQVPLMDLLAVAADVSRARRICLVESAVGCLINGVRVRRQP
jgi:hypothetical protein